MILWILFKLPLSHFSLIVGYRTLKCDEPQVRCHCDIRSLLEIRNQDCFHERKTCNRRHQWDLVNVNTCFTHLLTLENIIRCSEAFAGRNSSKKTQNRKDSLEADLSRKAGRGDSSCARWNKKLTQFGEEANFYSVVVFPPYDPTSSTEVFGDIASFA